MKKLIAIDMNDGGTRAVYFNNEKEMLDYVQGRDIKWISIYELGRRVDLITQPSVIINKNAIG